MDEIRGWSFSSIPSLFCFHPFLPASSQATSQMLQFHPGWVYELEVSCWNWSCGTPSPGYDSFVKGESYSYSSHSWNLYFHPLIFFLGWGGGGRNNHQLDQPFRITSRRGYASSTNSQGDALRFRWGFFGERFFCEKNRQKLQIN